MLEIAKTLNIPVELTIGDRLQVSTKSENYQEVAQELNQASGFRVSHLFSGMVQRLVPFQGGICMKESAMCRKFLRRWAANPLSSNMR